MRIQHNIAAMNSYRNYGNNVAAVNKNLEKLSSGYKINRAGDDAAGLAISEKMRAQIQGLNAAQKNVKDGISLVKTAEGAMQEIQDMLSRMKYLATQSANGTYDNDTDRFNLQKEVDSLRAEIDRIADSANFNGINLLDGNMGFGASNGAGGNTAAPTAPTAAVDSADAAGIGTVTVAFDANATADQKTALSTMAGSFKVAFEDKDGGTSATAGDELTVTGLDAMLPQGYTVTFTDATGDADATFTDGTAITVGTSAGEVDVSQDLVLTIKDENGDVAGTITIGKPTTITASTKNESTVTLTAASSGTGATGGTSSSGAVTGYEVTVTGDDGNNALAAGDSITIDNHTYNLYSGTGGGGSGDIDVDTEDDFAKQIQAAVDAYNAESDAKYTAAYADGKLTLTLNDGETAPTSAPTVTITDAASNISAGTVEEVKDTGNQQGNITGQGQITLQIGDTADTFNQLTVRIGDMHVSALGLRPGTADTDANGNRTGTYTYADVVAGSSIADIDISTLGGAQTAINVIKDAINYVSSVRGDLGAVQNRLEHTANNLSVMTENITDAESTIRDTDIAEEMMSYTKNNILIQSAQAMLAQANQIPQGVLQLLG